MKIAIALAVVAAALWLAGWLYPPAKLICQIGGLFSFVTAMRSAYQAISPWIGVRGENLLEQELTQLDDRYLLIRNWVPAHAAKPAGDIDFILLGPFGALVIEVKTYTVPTKCKNDRWWIQRENGTWRPIKSLSRQLAHNVKQVAQPLRQNVSGVLVFNDRADLRISSSKSQIIRRKELLGLVGKLPDSKQNAAILWKQLSGDEIPTSTPAVA